MNRDTAMGLVWGTGVLALVGSALVRRELPWRRGLMMAGAWVLVFAAVLVVADNRDALGGLARRTLAGVDPASGIDDGETLRVKRSDDGHFHVRGLVNGVSVRFLVDSGATRTSLSAATIAAAGLKPDALFGDATVQTANGEMAVKRVTVPSLVIGPIERHDIGAFTAAEADDREDEDLLGMDILSSLKGWRVEGEWLILEA